MFEPVRGSALDITDKGITNRLAAILSVAMMFEHLSLDAAAASVHQAVKDFLASGDPRTPHLGGSGTTEQTGGAVARLTAAT